MSAGGLTPQTRERAASRSMKSRCHGGVVVRGSWGNLSLTLDVKPGSISGHCVKRDVGAKSAYACTASVWKFENQRECVISALQGLTF